MKKTFITLSLLAFLGFGITSCEEKKQEPADQVEEAVNEAAEEVEESAEEVEEVESIEDASENEAEELSDEVIE